MQNLIAKTTLLSISLNKFNNVASFADLSMIFSFEKYF